VTPAVSETDKLQVAGDGSGHETDVIAIERRLIDGDTNEVRQSQLMNAERDLNQYQALLKACVQ
jgi:hypothetical protein